MSVTAMTETASTFLLKVLNIALWKGQIALKGSSICSVSTAPSSLQESFTLGLRGFEPPEKGYHPAHQISYTLVSSSKNLRRFLVLNTCRDDELAQVKLWPLVLSPMSKVCV